MGALPPAEAALRDSADSAWPLDFHCVTYPTDCVCRRRAPLGQQPPPDDVRSVCGPLTDYTERNEQRSSSMHFARHHRLHCSAFRL